MKITNNAHDFIKTEFEKLLVPYGITALREYKKQIIETVMIKEIPNRIATDFFFALDGFVQEEMIRRVDKPFDNDFKAILVSIINEIWKTESEKQDGIDMKFCKLMFKPNENL